MGKINKWHVAVAAEAFAAGVFARCGYDVSVQYGANQPEYDLMIAKDEKILKVSVKGSQDGKWGLSQKYLNNAEYHRAAEVLLSKHDKKTIFCFVQFEGIKLNGLPNIYLATPNEVANRLKESAGGRGASILYENHEWGHKATGAGTTDKIPANWKFSKERIEELFEIAYEFAEIGKKHYG